MKTISFKGGLIDFGHKIIKSPKFYNTFYQSPGYSINEISRTKDSFTSLYDNSKEDTLMIQSPMNSYKKIVILDQTR